MKHGFPSRGFRAMDLSSRRNSSNHHCSHATPVKGAGAFQLRNKTTARSAIFSRRPSREPSSSISFASSTSSASSAPRQLEPYPVLARDQARKGLILRISLR